MTSGRMKMLAAEVVAALLFFGCAAEEERPRLTAQDCEAIIQLALIHGYGGVRTDHLKACGYTWRSGGGIRPL